MSKTSLCAVVLIAMIMVTANVSYAFRLGEFEAGLDLSLVTRYDDNVYITNGNELDDFFFVISPGAYINNAQDRNNELRLSYHSDIYRYVDTGSLNDTEDHFVDGLIHLNKNGRLRFKLSDEFASRHESREYTFVTTGEIIELYSNEVEAELGFAVTEKLELVAAYNLMYIDFTDSMSSYRDRNDNSGSLTAYYQMFPKVRVLAQGIYKDVYHNSDSSALSSRLNSQEVWAMAGITWDITEKSTGIVKAGYEWKNMSHPSANDFSAPIFIVSLKHDFTPKTSVTLTGRRFAKETDDPNANYYTSSAGYVNVALHPIRKLLVSPYISYEHNRYSGATVAAGDRERRLENTFKAGLELGYEINDWLDVKVGYEHTKRSSTVTVYDFTRNLATVVLTGSI